MSVVLSLGVLAPLPAQAAAGGRPKYADEKPVKGHALKVRPRKAESKKQATLPAAVWPKAGSADADVPGAGRWAQVGKLPVWVAGVQQQRTATGARPARTVAPAERVRVRMLDRKTAQRAGVQGVMLTVSSPDAARTGEVTVGLNYAKFATAFGGAHGSRLKLVRYPACVLTTPERPECRIPTPVATSHDSVHQTLITQVQAPVSSPSTQPPTANTQQPPPGSTGSTPTPRSTPRNRVLSEALTSGTATGAKAAAADAGVTVLATAAGASSDMGDYKATQLTASSTWNVGTNTGEFTWSYPMRVPPVPGGMAPKVSIGYSSGSVDGMTSNTNSQSSWVGEGFSLWPGFIERRYKSCEDDGAPKDQWGNSPGDLCWGYDNATLTWNGKGGELVPRGDGTWRMKNDDGTRIEKLTGSEADTNNGDGNNEYWKVTTTDGARYYFGKHRLGGWSAGKAVTNSAWTVPVYGDDANDPCHDSKGFSDSSCYQAWRWNLDLAVDPNGNAIVYYYDQEENYYGKNLKPEDETKYIRGGVLNRIEYGLRSDNLWAVAPAKVLFEAKERCLSTAANCAEDQIDANENLWQDTPYDLNCKSGTECKDFHGTVSPTFWTRKRLVEVKTQVVKADSTWRDVDSWELTHKWGIADYDRSLLPISIQHTGHAASTAITLPKVTLDYEERYNRVRYGDTGGFMRYRLDYIADESGGEVSVAYSFAQCTATALPDPESNTKRCFPVYWGYDGAIDPQLDWFHKYVVTSVVARDRTGHNPDMVSKYVYDEDKGGAWHYDNDDGLTKEKYKTWSQWRGYEKVSVLTGSDLADNMTAQTDHYYLRGMHGDRSSRTDENQKRTVTVSDGSNDTVTDHDAYAGHELRTVQFDRPGGAIVNWKQNLPRKYNTASKTRPWGTITADMAVTEYARTFTPKGVGTWRVAQTRSDFDDETGRVNWVSDTGDTSMAADDRCTRYTYADNVGAWMRSYVAQTEVTEGTCLRSDLDRTKHVLSDQRTYYDGTTSAPKSTFKAVSTGRATFTERLVSHAAADGSDPTYEKVSAITGFDGYGRPTTVEDAKGNATTTTYIQTPGTTASPGLTTKVVATKPTVTKADNTTVTLSTTTTMDAAWGLPIVKVDEAGGKTDIFYDALGRLIKVWLPNQSRANGKPMSLAYTYQVTENAPVVVGSQTITRTGGLSTPTYQIFDGFLRVRQTQAPGQNGGRIITDTVHDGRGQVAYTYNGYYNNESGPTPALFGPDLQGMITSQTRYTYDGAGRKTREALLGGPGDTSEVFATAFNYGGDATGNWVTVDPPTGGTPTTTYTDARGRQTELRQYNTGSPTGTDYIASTFAYDAADRLTKITGPGGKVWSYEYDSRGRKIKAVDPDTGTTLTAFNELDQLVSTTDARFSAGDKTQGRVYVEYDVLGRKTRTRASDSNGAPGAVLSSWTYDKARKGQLDTETRRGLGSDGLTVHDYTTVVNAYDSLNRPTSTTVKVPQAEGALGKDYTFKTLYNLDGTVASTTLPATDDLPAESVSYSYDELKRPIGMSGPDTYVANVNYSYIDQVTSMVLGTNGMNVTLGYDYEPATRRLVHTTVSREDINGHERDATYAYDDAGNLTQINDASRAGTDNQCFRYDGQRRLTEAWAQGTATCAADAASAVIGGPAGYKQTLSYDDEGNRVRETFTDAQATRARDYQPPTRGHQLTSVAQTGAGAHGETFQYDAAGNTTSRTIGGTTQTLSWLPDGELAKISDGAQGDTSFVYNAAGDRLIRRDPTGTTLYLPGMEIRLAKNATTTTSTRYYSFGDQTVAMRTAAGVRFLAADHHGTAELQINAATQAVTQRRTTPFGQIRGTTAGTWLGEKGFVGGTTDTSTGLTHLGAREYDPATGRFISVDPLFDLGDPQSWNGYAYADNNPVVKSDPDGLKSCDGNTGDFKCEPGQNPNPALDAENKGHDTTPCYLRPKACGWTNDQAERTQSTEDQRVAEEALAERMESFDPDGNGPPAVCAGGGDAWVCEIATPGEHLAYALFGLYDLNDCLQGRVGVNCISWALKGAVVSKAIRQLRKCSSFIPGTMVVMADGSRKAINELKVGDKILATDPRTGKTAVKTVEATITSVGQKNLVEVLLDDSRGLSQHATQLVVSTDEHPFWVGGKIKEWVKAKDLQPGMWLRTSAGTYVRVTSVHYRTALLQRVHNLTVADFHTYYVEAGDTPVLVHNAGCGIDKLASKIDVENLSMTDTVANHAGVPVKKGLKQGLPQRPFMGRNDGLLLREIMEGSAPRLDPRGAEGALRWDTPGTMNGSEGTWELVIDANQNRILHWNFVK